MAAGHVIVVGAGLAGLSAAVELKKHGFEVELLERSRLLGGKATSFVIDGIEVDNGQHVFLACCTEFVDFAITVCQDTAILAVQPRFRAMLLSSRGATDLRAVPLPAPLHLAPALLRYRALGLADRVRLARCLSAAGREAVDPCETFANWLDRHGQTKATRRAFWEPFFVPALNAPLDQVSAESAVFVVRTAFLASAGAARFGFARQPLARIAEAAAQRLDRVHLRRPVAGLALSDGSKTASIRGVRLEDATVLECDGVILALPPHRLARVLGDPERFGVRGLDSFRHAPIVDVHLWFDRALEFDFGAVLDSPVQWVFQKAPGYLCCSMSAADRYVRLPNQDLIALCDAEVRAVLPALAGASLLRGAATRDPEATFIPSPGLDRPGPGTSIQGLAIAGAWTDTGWPATMESAVRSGRAAARLLAASLAHREEIAVG